MTLILFIRVNLKLLAQFKNILKELVRIQKIKIIKNNYKQYRVNIIRQLIHKKQKKETRKNKNKSRHLFLKSNSIEWKNKKL